MRRLAGWLGAGWLGAGWLGAGWLRAGWLRAWLLGTGLLGGLLGGCAGGAPAPADDSPEARCARQADNDPRLRELRMRMISNTYLLQTLKPELENIRKKAYDQCLLTYGIGVPGGVEKPRK